MPTYKNRNHTANNAVRRVAHQEESNRHKILSRDGKFNYDNDDAFLENDIDSESDYANCRESHKKVRHILDL